MQFHRLLPLGQVAIFTLGPVAIQKSELHDYIYLVYPKFLHKVLMTALLTAKLLS